LLLSKLEGIIPALESSHALAYLIKNSIKFFKGSILVITISGRGDKDLNIVREHVDKQNKEKLKMVENFKEHENVK
jgi:tryptophan synthase beta chain